MGTAEGGPSARTLAGTPGLWSNRVFPRRPHELGVPPLAQVIGFCCTFPFVAWGIGRGWPALARVLLAYGLAARIPVILVMLLAILGSRGTHYELGRPDLPPLEPPLLKWFVIGLVPQIGVWVSFTVVGGSFFGGLAALVRRRAPRPVSHAAA